MTTDTAMFDFEPDDKTIEALKNDAAAKRILPSVMPIEKAASFLKVPVSELRKPDYTRGEMPSKKDGISIKHLRDIERQIEGRPRKPLKSNPRHSVVLDQVANELEQLSKTSLNRRVLRSLDDDGIDTLGAITLLELATSLRVGTEGQSTTWVLDQIAFKLGDSKERRLILTVALRPALERILSLACRGANDPEAVYDMLGGLMELCASGSVVLEPLRGELRRHVRRCVDRRQREQRRSVLTEQFEEPVDPFGDPADTASMMIDELIDGGIINADEAELLIRSAINDVNADRKGTRALAELGSTRLAS